jgi:threonine dehydratase
MVHYSFPIPGFADILDAQKRIAPFINHTPVVRSEELDALLDAHLFFKCENRQEAGAFKYRGATNAVQRLTQEEALRGVATHSSGNHAAALALAAKKRGIPAFIVMPENAPLVKVERVRSYGGEITFCEPTLEARETTLAEVVAKTGATFIPPYDYFDVVCGQGTAAVEMLEDAGPFDVVMAPVGGGGLLSGTAIAVKHLSPSTLVIAGEPVNADDACRSFKAGRIIPSDNPDTISDGLKTSLGELNFEIIRRLVDDIYTATELSTRAAMGLLRKKTGLMVEPSSAVPLAALIEHKAFFRGKRVGIILSGGNITGEKFDKLVKEGG